MGKLCEGRVVVVTGAGRGLGREYALGFAREGAKVVVNDIGDGPDSPANQVVAEIKALGADAVANHDDVSDWQGAKALVETAVDNFGSLDVLVNNAGILRDRTLLKMSEQEWDDVIKVHLKGTFATTHFAANYWKQLADDGKPVVDARVINTTSASGLFGSYGQANYAAAKMGIAGFTITAAIELKKASVTVNAISPGALTRMTAHLGMDKLAEKAVAKGFDFTDPANVAPLVVWLGSTESAGITGQVFDIFGGRLKLLKGWRPGPSIDKGARWEVGELGEVVKGFMEQVSSAKKK